MTTEESEYWISRWPGNQPIKKVPESLKEYMPVVVKMPWYCKILQKVSVWLFHEDDY